MLEVTDEMRVAVLRELLAAADTDLRVAIAEQHGHYGQLEVTVGRRIRTWIAHELEHLDVDDIPEIPNG